ncbi:hypothetical protein PMAYCL1PPCAC_05886, partial [Pristionchus mayeri]
EDQAGVVVAVACQLFFILEVATNDLVVSRSNHSMAMSHVRLLMGVNYICKVSFRSVYECDFALCCFSEGSALELNFLKQELDLIG